MPALVASGGVAVAAALVALAGLLIRTASRALQPRVQPAATAYVAACIVGVAGVGLGAYLGSDHAGNLTARLRDVHETLNLLGLVGFVVAATLPFSSRTTTATILFSSVYENNSVTVWGRERARR